jgi:hypothetical protein
MSHLETLAQQLGQVVLHQALQICGGGEVLIRNVKQHRYQPQPGHRVPHCLPLGG